MLATLVLAVHVAVILFNVIGLMVIPIGGWLKWRYVHAPVWRTLHILSLGAVAIQAALGRPCFLTNWQNALTDGSSGRPPLIARMVDTLVYWPIPIWVFAIGYMVVFAYALALLWLVPPRRLGYLK